MFKDKMHAFMDTLHRFHLFRYLKCTVMLHFFFCFLLFFMTFEFDNTGRHRGCHGAQSIRKEILERQANEKEAEHKKLELMKDIKEQQTRLLHYTKQLQQQQTQLDNIHSETHKWVKTCTHLEAYMQKDTEMLL